MQAPMIFSLGKFKRSAQMLPLLQEVGGMPGFDLAVERIYQGSGQSAVGFAKPYRFVPARHLDLAMDGAGDVVQLVRDADGEVGQRLHVAAAVLLRREGPIVMMASLNAGRCTMRETLPNCN
jgi:hypothetical protein